MIYKPKKFELYELLPRKFYHDYKYRGDSLWYLFDDRLLKTLDELREKFGKTFINTWKWGGKREYSGWRPSDCEVGALFSQHKFGRACDCIFQDHRAQDVRAWIIDNKNERIFKYITGMEMEIPWLHIDVRNYNGLLLFKKV